jgi:hypothetical protein
MPRISGVYQQALWVGFFSSSELGVPVSHHKGSPSWIDWHTVCGCPGLRLRAVAGRGGFSLRMMYSVIIFQVRQRCNTGWRAGAPQLAVGSLRSDIVGQVLTYRTSVG